MKKIILALENDFKFPEAIQDFIDEAKEMGHEVIEFTNFNNVSKEDTIEAVKKANLIVCQTAFVNGSDYQLEVLVKMLSQLPDSKEIHISYYELKEKLTSLLTPIQIHSIKHHKIYEFRRYDKSIPLDFSKELKKAEKEIANELAEKQTKEEYTQSAKERPTGVKVKILGCTANAPGFKDLPIGEVVDVLDMSEYDNRPERGVWIWGNGEPVKLVNDCGFQEYEVTVEEGASPEELCEAVINAISGINRNDLTEANVALIEKLIREKDEFVGNLGNYICDILGAERRGNRQRVNEMLGC